MNILVPNNRGTTILTAIGPVTWGTTYLVTTQWLPPDVPLLSGVLRALPVGLLALAVTRTLPTGSWWWRVALLGVLNIGAFFPLLFVAAYRLPGGVAAVLGAGAPFVVAALAAGLLGERPTRWRLGWALAALVGVALVVLGPAARLDGWGIAAGLAATVSMATGTVLTKRWGRPVDIVTFTGWQLSAGGLAIAPVALLIEGLPPRLDAEAVLGYLWLAVAGTLLAYLLWFRGLGRLPAGQAAFLPLLSPVVAAAGGWVVLDQGLRPVQAAGFVLALVAIVAAQRPAPRTMYLPRPAAAPWLHGAADTASEATQDPARRGGLRPVLRPRPGSGGLRVHGHPSLVGRDVDGDRLRRLPG